MLLIWLTIGWLAGIVAADTWHLRGAVLPLAAALAVLLALVLRARPGPRLAALILCALALGAWRYDAARPVATATDLQRLNGTSATVRGIVIEDPRPTSSGQRLLIRTDLQLVGERVVPAIGLVRVDVPRNPVYRYGDQIVFTGDLRAAQRADRPGGFDYQEYLARRAIFSLCQPDQVRRIAQSKGDAFIGALLGFRERSRRVLVRSLPEPQAALAAGILLGLQSGISPAVADDFSITGTSHILVISGWNITIIAAALDGVATRARLSRGAAFWVTLSCIWLYTLFVGFTATVVRAAVMGTVVVVGKRLDREAHAWTTLLVACGVMTLANPQTLWDMGFQLSALATASLFAFGKGTEALLLRTPLRRESVAWAREALTATLAAQILALPLILYSFGNLSIVAPLANVAILPMVPQAMLFGAIALVGGLVWLPLGQALALLALGFLTWLTAGARLFASLPWAATTVPPFPLWALLTYYLLVGGVWWCQTRAAATRAPVSAAVSQSLSC